jgi:glyoxalase family protein
MALPPILGLHHVTATVDTAQADLDYYVERLGLRLVKKTVNFDNHHVYHFYYGTEHGSPGTIWTTFPYSGRGVPVGTRGYGQITTTSFSVPTGALDFWRDRLAHAGGGAGISDVVSSVSRTAGGEDSIAVIDPSGLVIALVACDDDRTPGSGGGISDAFAIRGLHSVVLTIAAPDPTIDFLRTLLGFEVTHQADGRSRLGVNGGGPGRSIDVVHDPDAPAARNGLGTVHHVAVAIATEEEQLAIRDEVLRRGVQVTPVLDRQYFRSIYFREPGGVLFEVATIAPGFAVDEDAAHLGQALQLPPWEEPNRAMIEAGLASVIHR